MEGGEDERLGRVGHGRATDRVSRPEEDVEEGEVEGEETEEEGGEERWRVRSIGGEQVKHLHSPDCGLS